MSDYKSAIRAHAEKMVKLFQEILFAGPQATDRGDKMDELERNLDDISNKFGVSIRQVENDVEEEAEHRTVAVVRMMKNIDQTVRH